MESADRDPKEKREAEEGARKGKYRVRKAGQEDAEALARMETQTQWEIRKAADDFLAKHGFRSSGKKRK